jgi:LmbE family N-acetylglucosaminyl deacetylase
MTLTWPAARHIYLSPHLDDAVLSCGGMIYRQAQSGQPVAVITLFAGSPPAGHRLSPFAESFHERWQSSAPPGPDFSDPPAVRRAEDVRAFATLSPAIRAIHLPLLDCIYRIDPASGVALYASEEALFGVVKPGDPAPTTLRDAPPLPPDAILYAPLSVGGHVDHRVVRSAVAGWDVPPRQVRYYTDYPYAARPGALEAVIGDGAGWESVIIPLDEEALAAKIEAVSQHASQIRTFWVDADSMAAALRDYTHQVGGEQLWLLVGA